jgi:hypothetical protein
VKFEERVFTSKLHDLLTVIFAIIKKH